MDKINEYLIKFGLEPYTKLPIVQKISQKLKLQPQAIIALFIGVVAFYCVLPFVGNFITSFICFLIPAYYTFKAIESAEQEDDNRLLTYWIIFGLIYSLDEIFRSVLSFIPFYHLIRFALLISLFHSNFNGAKLIYNQFLRPVFTKYVSQIDALIEPLEERSRSVGEQFKKKQ